MSSFNIKGFGRSTSISPETTPGAPKQDAVPPSTHGGPGLATRSSNGSAALRSAKLPFSQAANSFNSAASFFSKTQSAASDSASKFFNSASASASKLASSASASSSNMTSSASNFFKSMRPSTSEASREAPGPATPQPAMPNTPPMGGGLVRRNAIIGRSQSMKTEEKPPSRQSAPPMAMSAPAGGASLLRSNGLRRTNSLDSGIGRGPEKPALLSENTSVTSFLESKHPMDIGMKKQILSEQFQDKASFNAFLDRNLGGSVSDKLNAPASEWTTETFQALYVANWANHPVEKGSYMIDLSGVSAEQLEQIKTAHKQNCTGRPSSHLSGEGRSASKGFDFMQGYKELLVQMETIDGKPYMFLKAEGHTTGLDGIVGHTQSYLHKVKTGEGLMANQYLNALANASGLVEARAAENYGKNYGKLLKGLELDSKSKMVTTREMAQTLFEKSGFDPSGRSDTAGFMKGSTNEQLGQALMAYCNDASSGKIETRLKGDKVATDGMMKELREVAQSLIDDGATQHARVHREIISSPAELDKTVGSFKSDKGSGLRRAHAVRRESV
jgi:hypothetical protein